MHGTKVHSCGDPVLMDSRVGSPEEGPVEATHPVSVGNSLHSSTLHLVWVGGNHVLILAAVLGTHEAAHVLPATLLEIQCALLSLMERLQPYQVAAHAHMCFVAIALWGIDLQGHCLEHCLAQLLGVTRMVKARHQQEHLLKVPMAARCGNSWMRRHLVVEAVGHQIMILEDLAMKPLVQVVLCGPMVAEKP